MNDAWGQRRDDEVKKRKSKVKKCKTDIKEVEN